MKQKSTTRVCAIYRIYFENMRESYFLFEAARDKQYIRDCTSTMILV